MDLRPSEQFACAVAAEVFISEQPTSDFRLSNDAAVTDEVCSASSKHQSALARARAEFAAFLDNLMTEQVLAGYEVCSNASVARLCEVNVSVVRRWRIGQTPMPVGAIERLPAQLFGPVMDFLAARKRAVGGATPRGLRKLGGGQ